MWITFSSWIFCQNLNAIKPFLVKCFMSEAMVLVIIEILPLRAIRYADVC